MILAGIDEAGYGPVLGPLVVGCCAIEVAGEIAEAPCLWKLLRRIVGKSRDRKGKKLHINDSKLVYSTSAGLRELERAVLALLAACHGRVASLDELVQQFDPSAAGLLAEHPWYTNHAQERFPIELDGAAIGPILNALTAELGRAGVKIVHLGARIAPEGYLNRMFKTTRNKSSVLFSLSAQHLDHLLRNFGEGGGRRLIIHCDRQGGREHYGSLLRMMFADWPLTVVNEVESCSEYELGAGERKVGILFREKAESQWLPVAVASMISKYLREALMGRFNAYWAVHAPGVAPTAGYYTDGMRFLNDVAARRMEMGIGDEVMVRSR